MTPVQAAFALALLAAPALASAETWTDKPLGAAGRWTLDLSRSRFNDALTGPPPLSGELDVTKDDGRALAWTLVEEDEAGVAAIQFADALLDGPPVRAVVNLARVSISVQRTGPSSVVVLTHADGARRQSMRVGLVDPDTIMVEQDVDGLPGPPDQTLFFKRQAASGR